MTPEVRDKIRSRVMSGTAEMWDAAVLWQHIEALEALPVPEVTLEYRVAYERTGPSGWERDFCARPDKDAATATANACARVTFKYRNVRIESRVSTGPWLPVVQP